MLNWKRGSKLSRTVTVSNLILRCRWTQMRSFNWQKILRLTKALCNVSFTKYKASTTAWMIHNQTTCKKSGLIEIHRNPKILWYRRFLSSHLTLRNKSTIKWRALKLLNQSKVKWIRFSKTVAMQVKQEREVEGPISIKEQSLIQLLKSSITLMSNYRCKRIQAKEHH